MPNNDGIWLLNEINALSRPVPVIVLSGVHESQHLKLRTAPFIRKLLKPVDPCDLSRVIREVLRGVTGLSEQGPAPPSRPAATYLDGASRSRHDLPLWVRQPL
jgi:DNA-binding response OmpR family regulator